MEILITASEFATYRNISNKIDTGKIEEAIKQAQQTDLVEILGDFYFDVLKNKDESTYSDLLDGSTFTENGEEYEHAGIKRMLADYTYSRYIYNKPVNDSAFGVVMKDYQDGTPLDRNFIKDLSKQAQIDAGAKFRFIEKYILSKPDLFSRYCSNKTNGTSFNYQRFSKL